jgi:lysophospholipase L1-like esterase
MKLLSALYFSLIITSVAFADSESQLVINLKAGKKQTVVTYGTSLTAGGAWVANLQKALNEKFPTLATVINSGQGSKWSSWGVENLDSRVISKNPDTVLIEFGINDAFLDYNTSVEQARSNLETMVDRIKTSNPNAEVILMTMNSPIGVHLARRPKFLDYYQMYRDLAKERGLLLIDNYVNWARVMEDQTLFNQYVPDGIHPSKEGSSIVTTPEIHKSLGLEK